MRNFIVLLLCSMVLFSSCSIKENQLVIINDSDNSKNKPSAKLKDWQIETVSQKALIEKNKQVIEKIDKDIVPLAISLITKQLFAIKAL